MKRLSGSLLTLCGVLGVLLGLLFLVGADGQLRRLAIAAVGLFGGAAATGLGLKLLRVARSEEPEVLASRILTLARTSEGELSRGELLAELGALGGKIDAAMLLLEARGVCQRTEAGANPTWIFPAFQTEVLVRRCEFCGAELPLHEQLASCPKCGGTIATGVERFAAGGDSYSMDE
ncbi:MAG: hypothetical protein P1V51_07780 [Deltaproteobacteria bacterium]|nr:hypothetical protein [Deltaproteobacteria bacterium]